MKTPLVKKSVLMPQWVWDQLDSLQMELACLSHADTIRRVVTERLQQRQQAIAAAKIEGSHK